MDKSKMILDLLAEVDALLKNSITPDGDCKFDFIMAKVGLETVKEAIVSYHKLE